MWWLLVGLAVVLACFSFVLLFGAPYLPTLRKQIDVALDLLALEPGQTMLELGCGDGRVLRAAAKRGWHCVGYELNPILAAVAWLGTRRYRGQVQIICGNYWQAQWPDAAGIYGFILPRFMTKLDTKIIQEVAKPVRMVSFAFAVPGRRPARQQQGVFLYRYK